MPSRAVRFLQGLGLPRTVWALVAAAVLLRLYFWRYTGRTWEDALITVLHAENFWAGLGLTHVKPGEPPIHGFTSPISILVPLLGGVFHGPWGLPFQKLVSAFSAAGVIWIGYQLVRRVEVEERQRRAWILFSLAYIAFEHHQVLWGMAGMETTVVTLVLFHFFYACAVRSPRQIAVAMALSLYARPDFLFLNLIGLAYCVAYLRRDVPRIVALAFLLYLPWFLFTWVYYGSPIPNTILAKLHGYGHPPRDFQKFLDFLVPLGPSFAGHGRGYWREWDHGAISILVTGLFALGAWQAWVRRATALFVPAAFVVVYWLYYQFLVAGIFGWYIVPLSAATMLVAGYGLVHAVPQPRAALAVAAAYGVAIVAILPVTFRAEREIQQLIEAPVRTQMALYLRDAVGPGEFIGMESLGYSSYYTRKPILDYPGLASREVTQLLRAHPRAGLCHVLEKLEPRWVAVRDFECRGHAFLARHYELVREFKAPPAVERIHMQQYNIDKHFLVYRRKEKGLH